MMENTTSMLMLVLAAEHVQAHVQQVQLKKVNTEHIFCNRQFILSCYHIFKTAGIPAVLFFTLYVSHT